jgi:DNA-binding MarR family transcriptional regulator
VYIHESGDNMEVVKEEIKSSVCNCINLRRASQSITEVYDEYLKPSGIKIGQYSILKHIKELQPINVSELAIKLRLDRTTLVRNLKALEEQELIMDISEGGARNRMLCLTDMGKAKLYKGEECWKNAQDFFQEYIGLENLQALTKLLSKIENLAL